MIEDVLERPLAAITAVGTPILGVLGYLDPILSIVASNAGSLFTIGSVVGFSLAPRLEWVPTEAATALAVVTGAIYVAVRLEALVERITERLS